MTSLPSTPPSATEPRVGNIVFLGAGAMSEALLRGFLHKGGISPTQISLTNRTNVARLHALHETYGVHACTTRTRVRAALHEADIVFLATKPKDADEALQSLRTALPAHALLVSVAAGVTISHMQTIVGPLQPIIRTMPNTSCATGHGVTAWAPSEAVTARHGSLIKTLLATVGIVEKVPESLLNAITAVSGSGPAYVYYIMEAMVAGAVAQGIAPEQAQMFVVHTVLGAAHTALQTHTDPQTLRHAVTSPQGTTAAAIAVFQQAHLHDTIVTAMEAARQRADELSASLPRPPHLGGSSIHE